MQRFWILTNIREKKDKVISASAASILTNFKMTLVSHYKSFFLVFKPFTISYFKDLQLFVLEEQQCLSILCHKEIFFCYEKTYQVIY